MLVHASARTDDMMTEPLACQAGHTWVMDEVRFSYLYPALGDEGSENEQSCVLLVHKGRSRLLLTGDIEAASELRLAARLDVPLPVSVMTAPHHGSRSSSTAELLGTFSPEHVVFPAGLRNRWGFPHPEVVACAGQAIVSAAGL